MGIHQYLNIKRFNFTPLCWRGNQDCRHNARHFSEITPQDTTQTVMALNQTLYCTIKDAPYPVHVIWKDNDFNEITNSTEGYSIHQGTVNDNNTQTSTLSISAAKLREMDTSSPLTWRCSAQSLRFQESDPSADFNVVILFLPFGKIDALTDIWSNGFLFNFLVPFMKRLDFRDVSYH